ncbi:MAG: cysteine desulfurase [Arcobacter sp.]|uniref:cysteine desulfurase n=1 Tax=uncultured Arcobacter sp. TaxID=165434 RepID=UPI000CB9EF86|nr:cysteine desulfurase [uncultured Arcobacter sp.]PLY09205.1 MAG: cysteine desulfurase [Arcobacter sp.]
MTKLNILQYSNMQNLHIRPELKLSILENNQSYLELEKKFLSKYSFNFLNTFSFDKAGFLELLLQLNKKGKIAISVGETQSLIEAAKEFENLGLKLSWINLQKDGNINKADISTEFDFIFISSYVMDTFVKTNLKEIKKLTNAKIISNASANYDISSDAIYFDSYKLTGFFMGGVILFDEELFEEKTIGFTNSIAVDFIYEALEKQSFDGSSKELFEKSLKEVLKDDIYFFVDNKQTLPYSLHFALKGIKARELIRTLALDDIHITNGEGCSLGLSKPSRIIQAMAYDETTSRNSISFSFDKAYTQDEVEKIVQKLAKKYRQIKVLNEGN